jgi:hypothetical protein
MLLHIMQRGEAFDIDLWYTTNDVTPPLSRCDGNYEGGRKGEQMKRTPAMLRSDSR